MKKYTIVAVCSCIVLLFFMAGMLGESAAGKGPAPLKILNCKPKPINFGRSVGKPNPVTAAAIPPSPKSISPSPQGLTETKSKMFSESGEGKLNVNQAAKKVSKQIQKASELYLSNDDSMSLASAQRVLYAIDNFIGLYQTQVRPHELLNFFHFKTAPVQDDKIFSVLAEMTPRKEEGVSLSFAVKGKGVTKESRLPAVITLVIDRSGSMSSQGKMDYLKLGLKTLKGEFKKGDVINLIEFDHELCDALESFTVGRDNISAYDKTVSDLEPRGSTDLHIALVEGYKLAEKNYDPSKINRVILITDALANTGVLSPELMASIGKFYDTKKIALSGIGVGQEFNDNLFDELTELGRGAYLFLGTQDAAKRVFGSDFVSLLNTIARNVHFKVVFPKGLHLEQFYGEEVATTKDKIQPINYFAGTSQLFLLDLKGKADKDGKVGFEITYKDPDSDSEGKQEFSFNVSDLLAGNTDNIAKAREIMAFADLLAKTSIPGNPVYGWWNSQWNPTKTKVDIQASKKICGENQEKMKEFAKQYTDNEVKKVLDLAEKYCSRF